MSRHTTSLTLLLLLATLAPSPPAKAAASFEIINLDGPGEGLNDPAPVTPAGGNGATTLGQARLKAFEFAAAVWAQTLVSSVPIVIGLRFDPLGGDATSATLGTGGPAAAFRDFAGAPAANTWYPSALADKLAGVDLGGEGSRDITVTFNSDVDGPLVFGTAGFDYGLDDHPAGGNTSLVRVALHELAHGLGFTTLFDRTTGAKLQGADDAYLLHLERHGASPPAFSAMSDAQRAAATTAGAAVHFKGPLAVGTGASLSAGRGADGHLEMYAPATLSLGASLVHFATTLTPDQLQEPFYTAGGSIADQLALSRAVLGDLGWGASPGCLAPGPGETPPQTLASVDFSSGGLSGFAIVDVGTTSAPSAWAVAGGALVQSSNIYGDPLHRGTFAVWTAGSAWEDVKIRVQLSSADDDKLGVAFRYQDPNNFYHFYMDRQLAERRLTKVVGGVQTVLAQDGVAYRMNDIYLLEIVAAGDRLEVRLDGQTILTARDASLTTGTVALSSFGNAGSTFDRLEVESPVAEPRVIFRDTFADNNINGWSKVDLGTTSAPSSWSAASGYLRQLSNIYGDPLGLGTFLTLASGATLTDFRAGFELWSADDDLIGFAFRYTDPNNFYRFEWDKQNSRRWLTRVAAGTKTLLASDTVPYETTDHYYVEVVAVGSDLRVFVDGAPVFAVTDSTLPAGTVAFSSSANAGSYFDSFELTTPGPDLERSLLRDDFDDGNAAGWTITDVGVTTAPSAWSVVSGAFKQNSDIYGDALERGTFAVADGGAAWTDVRFRAQLWSADDDEIGLAFRYQDPNNFYRFDWDRQQNERRLVKVTGGVLTVLARDTVPYLINERYWVEIVAQGAHLTVRINGAPIFDVTDGTHTAGTVALSSYGVVGAFFDDVHVTELGGGL